MQKISEAIYSLTDQAIDNPSKVDVPRPISSSNTNEFLVAWFNIEAVSAISTMNVDCPVDWSSTAPTLVKILSTTFIIALLAGTKLPIWAKIWMRPICLMKQLLPLAFGPVNTIKFWVSLKIISLGINFFSSNNCSTIGFLPSCTWVKFESLFSISIILGLTKLFSIAANAKPNNASRLAIDFAIDLISLVFSATDILNSQKISYSFEAARFFISKILLSWDFIAVVTYLSSLVSVCLLIQWLGAKLTFDLLIEI